MPAYLVAYDIADPKRLRRVARAVERRAVRVQYSVFWFEGEPHELAGLLGELAGLVSLTEDVVQAWRAPPGTPPQCLALGAVRPVHPAAVVLAGRNPKFVIDTTPPPELVFDSRASPPADAGPSRGET